MSATVCLMSYLKLTSLVEQLQYSPPAGVQLKIVDALLGEALKQARALDKSGDVDVFVSSGANYHVLAGQLTAPLVEIKVTGFDFLLALKKAAEISSRIALLTVHQRISYLDMVNGLLRVPIRQETFNSEAEVDAIIRSLKQEGYRVCLGGSLVCEKAKEYGMEGIFVYSEDGVTRALEEAGNIAQARKKEMAKTEQLRAIINFAYEGVIATDKDGTITVFNPIAEKITGISRERAIGHCADDVVPNTRLVPVMRSRTSEINRIQTIGDVKILTNRVPIMVQDDVVGSVATFKDVGMIQAAEKKIREKLYLKGFVAKNEFDDIIGDSRPMREAKAEAAQYAASESTVLILGQTGTGKEMFAQAIHNAGNRAKHPFVAINCAALPPSLLESELFGYEEGAFTGAKKGGKLGLFELAHEGTVFLDEIGEMTIPIQSRLLRVLEEHEVLRIGGERIVPVDIRIIAATNKNLWDMVQDGLFREDLYYRLSVLEIHIPALRDHKQDIPGLVESFLRQLCPELPLPIIQKVAGNPKLREYHWPGNVRELRNVVERIAVLHKNNLSVESIIAKVMSSKSAGSYANCERDKLMALLAETAGNKTEVARKMGISRTTLWRKLRELGIG